MFNINFADDWIQTGDLWYSEVTALPTDPQPLPIHYLLGVILPFVTWHKVTWGDDAHSIRFAFFVQSVPNIIGTY